MNFDCIKPWNHCHNQDNEHIHPKFPHAQYISPFQPHLQVNTDLLSVILAEFALSRILYQCDKYYVLIFVWLLLHNTITWRYTHVVCINSLFFLLLSSILFGLVYHNFSAHLVENIIQLCFPHSRGMNEFTFLLKKFFYWRNDLKFFFFSSSSICLLPLHLHSIVF